MAGESQITVTAKSKRFNGEDYTNSVFIAWRRLSKRTFFLSRELGLELFFIPDNPLYLKAAWETWRLLSARKHSIVFLQLPQGPLLAEAVSLSKRKGFKTVADVHTGFIYPTSIKEYVLNKPFQRYLQRVDLVLAHNRLQAELIRRKTGIPDERMLLVYDPVPIIPSETRPSSKINVDMGKTIVFPASWAIDEPLDLITAEFLDSEASRDHVLVITGNYGRNRKLYARIRKLVKYRGGDGKVVLTGYMPDDEYYHVIKHCKAVIAMSSKEYTFPHALWEAVATGKPFITLGTETMLDEIGRDYPCFFTMNKGSLRETLDHCTLKEYQKAWKASIIKAEELKAKSNKSLAELRKIIFEVGTV